MTYLNVCAEAGVAAIMPAARTMRAARVLRSQRPGGGRWNVSWRMNAGKLRPPLKYVKEYERLGPHRWPAGSAPGRGPIR